MLVCRKILSVFYPILHKTFSNSCGFTLYNNLNFSFLSSYFIKGNIFVQSWLILATFHTASHQKFLLLSSDLKIFPTTHFPRMQPFRDVRQNRCSYKTFRNSQENVLESIYNKITGLMTCNLIKKETQLQVFSCGYHKIFENSFLYRFMENLWWLLLKMVEIFVQKNL